MANIIQRPPDPLLEGVAEWLSLEQKKRREEEEDRAKSRAAKKKRVAIGAGIAGAFVGLPMIGAVGSAATTGAALGGASQVAGAAAGLNSAALAASATTGALGAGGSFSAMGALTAASLGAQVGEKIAGEDYVGAITQAADTVRGITQGNEDRQFFGEGLTKRDRAMWSKKIADTGKTMAQYKAASTATGKTIPELVFEEGIQIANDESWAKVLEPYGIIGPEAIAAADKEIIANFKGNRPAFLKAQDDEMFRNQSVRLRERNRLEQRSKNAEDVKQAAAAAGQEVVQDPAQIKEWVAEDSARDVDLAEGRITPEDHERAVERANRRVPRMISRPKEVPPPGERLTRLEGTNHAVFTDNTGQESTIALGKEAPVAQYQKHAIESLRQQREQEGRPFTVEDQIQANRTAMRQFREAHEERDEATGDLLGTYDSEGKYTPEKERRDRARDELVVERIRENNEAIRNAEDNNEGKVPGDEGYVPVPNKLTAAQVAEELTLLDEVHIEMEKRKSIARNTLRPNIQDILIDEIKPVLMEVEGIEGSISNSQDLDQAIQSVEAALLRGASFYDNNVENIPDKKVKDVMDGLARLHIRLMRNK